MVESIANLSILQSQAQVQMAAAVKVFKMTQGQDEAVLSLLQDAVQAAEESIQAVSEGLGANVDAYG